MTTDIKSLNILICDDSITNVMILAKLLESEGFTSVKSVTDPVDVLPTLEKEPFDLLLLDIEMPHMDGFAVMEQITASPISSQLIPILVLTGRQGAEVRNRALESGAQDFVNKPFDQTEVLLRVRNLLRVRAAYLSQLNLAHALEKKVEERTAELNHATDILIERLAMAGEMRDTDTGKHVLRVGQYARVLSDAYGLPPEVGYLIEKAAPLHDLGKIGIPDTILLKRGNLSEEERTTMRKHAEMGAELLSNHESMLVRMAASIALSHHERWDGGGYPRGLAGESIPVEGRITALADVFDALTTQRPYKTAWSVEDALDYMRNMTGSQFEPRLVRLFNDNMEKILEIKKSYNDTPFPASEGMIPATLRHTPL